MTLPSIAPVSSLASAATMTRFDRVIDTAIDLAIPMISRIATDRARSDCQRAMGIGGIPSVHSPRDMDSLDSSCEITPMSYSGPSRRKSQPLPTGFGTSPLLEIAFSSHRKSSSECPPFLSSFWHLRASYAPFRNLTCFTLLILLNLFAQCLDQVIIGGRLHD